MLDINLIRVEPEIVRQALIKRQMDADVVEQVQELDVQRRTLLLEAESLKAERNTVSRLIGQTKDSQERQQRIEEMRLVGDRIALLDEKIRQVEVG